MNLDSLPQAFVKIHPSLGPKQFVGKNGKLTGLEVIRCTSVFDEQKRFNPKFAEGTETILPCDTVILAIGQASDLSFLKPSDGIETTRQGTLKIDPATLMTAAPGIFRSEEHTSELQSRRDLVCRLLLEKKK